MLTRLEADGFKNLLDFSLDFGPLTCIAGPNGVGKSNIFDAIEFLSLLADHPLLEAAARVDRSEYGATNPGLLFWQDGENRRGSFRLAAEMIVEPEIRDDLGQTATPAGTFLRYEVEIGFEEDAESFTNLVLLSERLDCIAHEEVDSKLRFPHDETTFRKTLIRSREGRPTELIRTRSDSGGEPVIQLCSPEQSRDRLSAPARGLSKTIVSTVLTAATPTILAARREMQSWKVVALQSTAIRRPDSVGELQRSVGSDGAHLPATLRRLVAEARERGLTREDVSAEIASHLSLLTPIRGLEVVVDRARQTIEIDVETMSGLRLPWSQLGNGTLRFFAILLLSMDWAKPGVLCLEEPESGMHPAMIESVNDLLRDLVVDLEEPIDDENLPRQLIMTTHSPLLVQIQDRNDVVLAKETSLRGRDGKVVKALACFPLTRSWRAAGDSSAIGEASLADYLAEPPGASISLSAA